MGRPRKYFSEEERKSAKREQDKKWKENNRERQRNSNINWAKRNPLKLRANQLHQAYNKEDVKKGRGKGNLTANWIIENIFTQPCAHCGKTGWDVIGCNRLDNSKPHTMDNVEPCCKECNCKLGGEYTRSKKGFVVIQINIETGEIINKWNSANEAGKKLGYSQSRISEVCRGERKTYKGFKWNYLK